MRTRSLSVAEKFYVDAFAKKKTVEEIAKDLGTSTKSVEKYLDTLPKPVKSKKVATPQPQPELPAQRPLENTGLRNEAGSVSMTGRHSQSEDEVGKMVGKSAEVFKQMHGNDVYVPHPELPVN